jgi:hypothetical protein
LALDLYTVGVGAIIIKISKRVKNALVKILLGRVTSDFGLNKSICGGVLAILLVRKTL